MPWKILKGYEPTIPSFSSYSGIGFLVPAKKLRSKTAVMGP